MQKISQGKKHLNLVLTTAGGKITCTRCQAMSKRTRQQCGAPAEKGKQVCRFHGARSSGARTEAGRQRIAQAKTQHGDETRQARAERSEGRSHSGNYIRRAWYAY